MNPRLDRRAEADGPCQVFDDIAGEVEGRAEATNPMPLVLPCHRVLGSDGKLHGYGGPGGIGMKEWLLDLERQHSG